MDCAPPAAHGGEALRPYLRCKHCASCAEINREGYPCLAPVMLLKGSFRSIRCKAEYRRAKRGWLPVFCIAAKYFVSCINYIWLSITATLTKVILPPMQIQGNSTSFSCAIFSFTPNERKPTFQQQSLMPSRDTPSRLISHSCAVFCTVNITARNASPPCAGRVGRSPFDRLFVYGKGIGVNI